MQNKTMYITGRGFTIPRVLVDPEKVLPKRELEIFNKLFEKISGLKERFGINYNFIKFRSGELEFCRDDDACLSYYGDDALTNLLIEFTRGDFHSMFVEHKGHTFLLVSEILRVFPDKRLEVDVSIPLIFAEPKNEVVSKLEQLVNTISQFKLHIDPRLFDFACFSCIRNVESLYTLHIISSIKLVEDIYSAVSKIPKPRLAYSVVTCQEPTKEVQELVKYFVKTYFGIEITAVGQWEDYMQMLAKLPEPDAESYEDEIVPEEEEDDADEF